MMGIGEKTKSKASIAQSLALLPRKDSNPHRRNQNPKCYHYTTRQFFVLRMQSYKIILTNNSIPNNMCEVFFESALFCTYR